MKIWCGESEVAVEYSQVKQPLENESVGQDGQVLENQSVDIYILKSNEKANSGFFVLPAAIVIR